MSVDGSVLVRLRDNLCPPQSYINNTSKLLLLHNPSFPFVSNENFKRVISFSCASVPISFLQPHDYELNRALVCIADENEENVWKGMEIMKEYAVMMVLVVRAKFGKALLEKISTVEGRYEACEVNEMMYVGFAKNSKVEGKINSGTVKVESKRQFAMLWTNPEMVLVKSRIVELLGARMKVKEFSNAMIELVESKFKEITFEDVVRDFDNPVDYDDYTIYSELHKIFVSYMKLYPESKYDRGDKRAKELLNQLPRDFRPRNILDFGCAEGKITGSLGKILNLHRSNVHGCDIRDISVSSSEFTFTCASGESLPYASEMFDLVVVSMVLHHIPNVESVVQEIVRVISPGGILLLREHDCEINGLSMAIDIQHGLYALVWSEPQESPDFCQAFYSFYRPRSAWKSMLLQSGLFQHEKSGDTESNFRHVVTPAFQNRWTNPFHYYGAIYYKTINRNSHRSSSPQERYSKSRNRSPIRRRSRSPRYRYSRSRSANRYNSPRRRYSRSRSPSRCKSPKRRYSRSRSPSRYKSSAHRGRSMSRSPQRSKHARQSQSPSRKNSRYNDHNKTQMQIFITNIPLNYGEKDLKKKISVLFRNISRVYFFRDYWNKRFLGYASATIETDNPDIGTLLLDSMIISPSCGKKDFMFPFLTFEQRSLMKVDEVANFSVTDQYRADLMTDLLASITDSSCLVPLKTPFSCEQSLMMQAKNCSSSDLFRSKSTIIDGTACSGGNTISFSWRFKFVRSYEFDYSRYNDLKFNIDTLNICNVDLGHEATSCVTDALATYSDVMFFDPPWGGLDYKKEKSISLFLGEMDISELTFKLRGNTRLVALKAPNNFAMEEFLHKNSLSLQINHNIISKLHAFTCKSNFAGRSEPIDMNSFFLSEYIFKLEFEKMLLILVYYPSNFPAVIMSNDSLDMQDSLTDNANAGFSNAVSFEVLIDSIKMWKHRHQIGVPVFFYNPYSKSASFNGWNRLEEVRGVAYTGISEYVVEDLFKSNFYKIPESI